MTPDRSAGAPPEAQDDDLTRPLLIGYLQRQLLVTDGQVEAVKSQFASFAKVEGYAMGSTYVEHPGNWPAAFEALIEAVRRYQATAVVVPGLLHFTTLGASTSFKQHFEDATGAHVLTANGPSGHSS